MIITLDVPPEMEGQLRQAAQAVRDDVVTYLLQSAYLRLRPDVLTEADAELLQVINAPLAPEARSKQDVLLAGQARRELSLGDSASLSHGPDLCSDSVDSICDGAGTGTVWVVSYSGAGAHGSRPAKDIYHKPSAGPDRLRGCGGGVPRRADRTVFRVHSRHDTLS